jgi:hypothetical protein
LAAFYLKRRKSAGAGACNASPSPVDAKTTSSHEVSSVTGSVWPWLVLRVLKVFESSLVLTAVSSGIADISSTGRNRLESLNTERSSPVSSSLSLNALQVEIGCATLAAIHDVVKTFDPTTTKPLIGSSNVASLLGSKSGLGHKLSVNATLSTPVLAWFADALVKTLAERIRSGLMMSASLASSKSNKAATHHDQQQKQLIRIACTLMRYGILRDQDVDKVFSGIIAVRMVIFSRVF